MNQTLKRILLIALLLAVSALIALGLYVMFKRAAVAPGAPATAPPGAAPGQLPAAGERPPEAPGAEAPGAPGALPEGAALPPPPGTTYFTPEPVTQISPDAAAFASLDPGGGVRYHNVSDGKFYTVGADGRIRALTDAIFFNVDQVTWAKGANKAVLEYPDGAKIVYDFDRRKQVSLPRHWDDFSFSPDSGEIAAKSLGLSPDNRWLIVTKDDGTGTRLIEPLGDNADRVTVDWSPSRQTVAMSRTGQPQGGERQEVLFVGLNGENFKSTVVEGLDFEPAWSPSGRQLLYSVDSARTDFKPELWIVSAYGDEIGSSRRSLKLNTWARKCAFGDETTLFCAVPRDLPTGAGVSPSIADTLPDDLYKIDVRSGFKTIVPIDEDGHTINSLSYDSKNNKLFFTDRSKTGVFQVNL